MTDADLSQVYLETVTAPTSPESDLSQVYLEVLEAVPGDADLSQVYLESLTVPSAPEADLSQVYLEAVRPAAAPQTTGVTVEIFVFGAWTDITQYVLYRNGSGRVKITRGRPDETSQIQPQTCTFQVNNRDGRFSPRNPTGPYYGQLGRNTPVRVWRPYIGTRYYRFYGEASAWPVTWDMSGKDVWVDVTASGMLRRIAQGAVPQRSAFYRAYALGFSGALKPVAYWPCEDGTAATQIASGLPSGTPMTVVGGPTFASNSSFPCSDALPALNSATLTGTVPASAGPDNVLRFLLSIPAGGAVDTAVIARLNTAGAVARLDLQYGTGSNGQLNLTGFDASGTQLFTTGYTSPSIGGYTGGFNGLPVFVSMEMNVSGADILYQVVFEPLVAVAGTFGTSFTLAFGTLSSTTIGTATRVVMNPDRNITDTAVGHVIYQSTHDPLANTSFQLNAWISEVPSDRFTRLCSENGVGSVLVGSSAGDPTSMGYQLNDTFANLVQEPAATSLGLMYESRSQLALALRSRLSLYNQAAKLTLDYAQHALSAPLDPVDDDALTRNDVTVQRAGGSQVQRTLTSGALSTAAPPNGVGDYSTSYQISLGSDSLLADQAGWRLHTGTVDEPRYPRLSVNLRHSTFTSNSSLTIAALTTDIGDRLLVDNPPVPRVAPDEISQLVQGYAESIGAFEHDIVFNCSPESPFEIAVIGDAVLGHLDTDGSTLHQDYSSGAASLLVDTTNASSPLWTTAGGDFPFDVNIGGERITVTNITGGSSPQTFTVTRSVNGVVKAQSSGTDVRLWQPMILAF